MYDLHVSKKGYVKYTDNVYNKRGEKCTYIFVCLDIPLILRMGAACKYNRYTEHLRRNP